MLAQSPHFMKLLKGAPGIEGASGSSLKGNNVDVIALWVRVFISKHLTKEWSWGKMVPGLEHRNAARSEGKRCGWVSGREAPAGLGRLGLVSVPRNCCL